MGTSLHALIVEDGPDKAELLTLELKRAGFELTTQFVDTPAEYLIALAEQPHLVLTGYSLAGFSAPDVLDMLHEQGYDVPVIVLGEPAEESDCAACLGRGAVDYLIRDRLARLGPAVDRVLAHRRLVSEWRRAERTAVSHVRRFRAAFDHTPIGMALTTAHGYVLDANRALGELTGYPAAEIRSAGLMDLVLAEDRHLIETLEGRPAHESPVRHEIRLRRIGGTALHAVYTASVVEEGPADAPGPAGRHVLHQFAAVRRPAEPAPAVPEPAAAVPEPAPAVPEPAAAVPEPAPAVPEPAPAG